MKIGNDDNYICSANLPETPMWNNTIFSDELENAIKLGYKNISTPDGCIYKIINKNSVLEKNKMKSYIGTKLINAKPMNRLDYNNFRGWRLPENEDGRDDGYLVEYLDGGRPNTGFYDGYISWSPKEQFNNAYKESGNLSFGDAIVYMKYGYKVARSGWDGKDMWIAISDNLQGKPLEADKFWNPHAKQSALDNDGSMVVLPTVIMKTSTNEILMGWLASQSDMLAEDWIIVQGDK